MLSALPSCDTPDGNGSGSDSDFPDASLPQAATAATTAAAVSGGSVGAHLGLAPTTVDSGGGGGPNWKAGAVRKIALRSPVPGAVAPTGDGAPTSGDGAPTLGDGALTLAGDAPRLVRQVSPFNPALAPRDVEFDSDDDGTCSGSGSGSGGGGERARYTAHAPSSAQVLPSGAVHIARMPTTPVGQQIIHEALEEAKANAPATAHAALQQVRLPIFIKKKPTSINTFLLRKQKGSLVCMIISDFCFWVLNSGAKCFNGG